MGTDTDVVTEWIGSAPPQTREILKEIRALIRSEAPEATEDIRYGIPTFLLNGNLVHYAGYEGHIGFYPGPEALERFREELSSWPGGKGSVRFPLDRPVPLDLIREITAWRVQEQRNKGNDRKNPRKMDPGGSSEVR